MSRVKRTWGLDEGVPSLILIHEWGSGLHYTFRCPRCDRLHQGRAPEEVLEVTCDCGCHLRLTVRAALEELEVEG